MDNLSCDCRECVFELFSCVYQIDLSQACFVSVNPIKESL